MRIAYVGADIFDGHTSRSGQALVVEDGQVAEIVSEAALPSSIERRSLDGGLLAPGFVDIQVNGGGGVLLNEEPTVEGIRRICAAHARYGSTALLPTVITDRPEITFAAIEAAAAAVSAGVPGCIGIHVEGPFLSVARKGAHDPALIRRMEASDLEALLATTLRPLLLTVAPESVSNAQISALSEAGIRVSLGHSDTDFETATAAFAAGASCVTHLFNAMSQMNHRSPGLVGAALASQEVWCGFIPDGFHVHPAALGAALRAKSGKRKLVAVTDAMPTVGSSEDRFELGGRVATRQNGRLTLADGTLAGSDLTMIGALHYLVRMLGVPLEEALRMCSLYPAEFLGLSERHGQFRPGSRADMVWINEVPALKGVWIGGNPVDLQQMSGK
ncbi:MULTISPECIES: N-acetylglucosamine-6-phosphate deacetylase [unclassified Aureimonas]|uniref:N-acetylglucosamine-6-phosphate deacetylase n=1 Tax=unclassified Aureimonas TaxID=2615206 RepID=UPI00070235B6|nr:MULTISPECIES: N-acetylglucosamine-6-phosphate deacetylase [unclassified Aureimonas]KQT55240.1 N-acetylglucosamine-6-phosphate deacetylase [Aureimonas sp. Leaf427]KQT71032.1 N-acetylglucosamine-6-phosphate deacetylase [Aureimonas sp. Leaf460]